MWTATIKRDPKNSEAANKSHRNSDKRLFPLKIYHACGSSHRAAAHLPHFSSHWHLLTARPCPFLISFEETSICHFFFYLFHSPQGRWVFLNCGELARVIFLPAKQRKKASFLTPHRFPFPNTIDLNSRTLWSVVSLMLMALFSPEQELHFFSPIHIYVYVVVAKTCI